MYDKNLTGLICVGNGTFYTYGNYDGGSETTRWVNKRNVELGVFTGDYYDVETSDPKQSRRFVIKPFPAYGATTIEVAGDLQTKTPGSFNRKTAQDILNGIIKDHTYIMQNLEVCSMLSMQMQETPEVAAVKDKLATLYINLRGRELIMKDEGLLESYNTGATGGAALEGATYLHNLLEDRGLTGDISKLLRNRLGIGAIPAVAVYIIVAVVSVAVGAFIYYKLTNLKKAADYDLNLSNEFLSWLKKQSPETTKIVLDQLKATGDSAYKAALNEKGTGLVNWIKNAGTGVKFALMAAGGFLVYTQIDKIQTNKAKRKFKYGR